MDIEKIKSLMQERMNMKNNSHNSFSRMSLGYMSDYLVTLNKMKEAIKIYQQEEKDKGNENILFEFPQDQRGKERVIEIYKTLT